MKNETVTTKDKLSSEITSPANGFVSKMQKKNLKKLSPENLEKILEEIKNNLDGGFSMAAEILIQNILQDYSVDENQKAVLIEFLSYTLETKGNYKESLEVIKEYGTDENLEHLKPDNAIGCLVQLAIAYNNLADQPKAVALLDKAIKLAKGDHNVRHLLGNIYVAFARVYRKLNEFLLARTNAEKALGYFREYGNWRGMSETYREIAGAYHQSGNSEKSIENFNLGIKIIGERTAPFMLGKLYSDMSGAYWFLRRPQEGIACLEKSINYFDQTEHKIQSIAAYNNLGINLMLLGEWDKAESVIKKSLDIAYEVNHAHIAGILDSLGEIKLLRGEFEEAQQLLKEGVRFAEERKKEWYAIQAMRNLARCLLAEGKPLEAEEKARETIDLCQRINEKQVANMARLVLAESYFETNRIELCEQILGEIEDTDATSDFFVLGNIQRIRASIALVFGDEELALHHLSRSLTMFETADDFYYTALIHYLLGKTIGQNDPKSASRHLILASESFRKLRVLPLYNAAEELIERYKNQDTVKKVSSAGSQLLMVRIAEAVASRELLFRELVAVLQQESNAKRLIIAEFNEQKRLSPSILHGYSQTEITELANDLNEAHRKNNLEQFAKKKNFALYQLKTPNAPSAMLLVYPRSGAVLSDGSPLQPLLRVVELGMDVCALRVKDSHNPVEEETSPFTSQSLMPGFIHSSPAMTDLVEDVYKIRSSDVTVLVTGESGTGKELVSRAIHTISSRKDKVFLPFNCTTVPKELAEGHLFGYRKGAFTGAVTDSPGLIRAADGGTMFLDEVGDLPLDVQPKLLRFLQEGEIQPIGEKSPIKVDVRIIAATNMPLEEKVAEGTFREDLYYRLNVIRLRVPPLRERRSEIPPMVNYYINHYSAKFGRCDLTITPQAVDLLMVCEWEGNVRQLCNEIQRLVARASDGEVLGPEHLSKDLKRNVTPVSSGDSENGNSITNLGSFYGSSKAGVTIETAVSELEIQMISDALRRHEWNISRVARELGLTRRGLYLKLARYGIEKAA
ncbi:MAG: sigma 54-interacting transcriptional regulator [Pyrinomonadaceae bacterium]